MFFMDVIKIYQRVGCGEGFGFRSNREAQILILEREVGCLRLPGL